MSPHEDGKWCCAKCAAFAANQAIAMMAGVAEELKLSEDGDLGLAGEDQDPDPVSGKYAAHLRGYRCEECDFS
jgi:hypothetical protein